MTQLIINGLVLPQTSNDKYKCYLSDLAEWERMINGRRVGEIRGQIAVIEYSYDKMADDKGHELLRYLRSGTNLDVSYLPSDSNNLRKGIFQCVKRDEPIFAFSKNGKAFWHNISFTLESAECIQGA